jgi:hypothetical protein
MDQAMSALQSWLEFEEWQLLVRRPLAPYQAAYQTLRPIVSALQAEDAAMRQLLWSNLQQGGGQSVVQRAVEQLIVALKSRQWPGYQRAAAALVSLGRPALPALILTLLRSRRALFRARVIDVITTIAATLEPSERLQVLHILKSARLPEETPAVCQLLDQARATLRPDTSWSDASTATDSSVTGQGCIA